MSDVVVKDCEEVFELHTPPARIVRLLDPLRRLLHDMGQININIHPLRDVVLEQWKDRLAKSITSMEEELKNDYRRF